MTLPTLLIICSTIAFLLLERIFPGRNLPHAPGWYARALMINLAQLGITLATGQMWLELLGRVSLFELGSWSSGLAGGFVAWFIGTFVFYWWHRVRHLPGFWRTFHQLHHSPSRIEILTSFYKHPVEIFTNSLLSAIILYPLLGCSLIGAVWYNFFAATGEYFYHANLRTPKWLRYFIQTPELHSIHHQLDVHRYNYSDIPIWDRLFGTYKDTTNFVDQCGFPGSNETRLREMLLFRDVYETG
ncbi:MAG TPA: sterol desaturase family protein [Gammaproteobacteria bacterium]|nr:sterol desaturase family protein [Gammaproteobacteria bacterium]